MTEEDDVGNHIQWEEALGGNLELASSLVGSDVEAEDIIRDGAKEPDVDTCVSNGPIGAVMSLTCEQRPNLQHREKKKGDYQLKFGSLNSRGTGT